MKKVTWEEVGKHRTSKDVWFVIEGTVYDVTPYMYDHPGGPIVLSKRGGQDATSDFISAGHTENARNIMKKYVVGEIDTSMGPKSWQKVEEITFDLAYFRFMVATFVFVYLAAQILKKFDEL